MANIVDTDNYDGDYPDEKFLLWDMSKDDAQAICDILNRHGQPKPRYYKVVEDGYKLQPGFTP